MGYADQASPRLQQSGGCARQQERTHHLGAADSERELSAADWRFNVEMIEQRALSAGEAQRLNFCRGANTDFCAERTPVWPCR